MWRLTISPHPDLYALNLDKLKEICMTPLQGNQKEQEIVQTYEADDAGDFTISQKIERETRNNIIMLERQNSNEILQIININQQNDMLLYDFVKTLMLSILDDNTENVSFTNMPVGLSLSINTLLTWGILEELS